MDWKEPQHMFNLVLATLLIGDLQDKGLVEGPMTVMTEKCYAQVKMIHATEEVTLPDRETLVELAYGLMLVSAKNGIPEDDQEGIKFLLQHEAQVDTSWAE